MQNPRIPAQCHLALSASLILASPSPLLPSPTVAAGCCGAALVARPPARCRRRVFAAAVGAAERAPAVTAALARCPLWGLPLPLAEMWLLQLPPPTPAPAVVASRAELLNERRADCVFRFLRRTTRVFLCVSDACFRRQAVCQAVLSASASMFCVASNVRRLTDISD